MGFKLYETLGLDRNTNPSEKEIKKAYRKLAMDFHPDKNKGNVEAEAKFKEISNAYDTLSDEKKKRIYDQTGDEGFNNHNGNDDFERRHHDIFEQFFSRKHPFNHFGFNQEERENTQCNTLHKKMNISLKDAYDGVNKNFTIQIHKYCHDCMKKCNNCNGEGTIKQVKSMGIFTQIFTGNCDTCSGSGFKLSRNASCGKCKGEGNYKQEISANLNLPKGINNGYKTSFPEMGEQPKSGSKKAGDLVLEINIQEDDVFKRNGNDLYHVSKISFIHSIVGTTIHIPYFTETLDVDTKTLGVVHPGKQYMIEEKGMPILNTSKKGNMFVEFKIIYPKIKSGEKLDVLEKVLNETFYL